jgi:hypothetical protein
LNNFENADSSYEMRVLENRKLSMPIRSILLKMCTSILLFFLKNDFLLTLMLLIHFYRCRIVHHSHRAKIWATLLGPRQGIRGVLGQNKLDHSRI